MHWGCPQPAKAHVPSRKHTRTHITPPGYPILVSAEQGGASWLDGSKSVHQQALAPDVGPAHLHVAHLVHSVHCNAAWLCSFQCAKHAVLCSPLMLPFPAPSTVYAVTCLHACRCHLRRPPACPCACLQHSCIWPRRCMPHLLADIHSCHAIPAVLCCTAVWHNNSGSFQSHGSMKTNSRAGRLQPSWQRAPHPALGSGSTSVQRAHRGVRNPRPTPTFAWSPKKKKQKACYGVDRFLVGDARQLAQVSARGNGPGKALGAATSTLRGHRQGARAVHVVCPTQCGRSGLHNADDDRAAQLHRPFPWPCFCMLMEPPSCRAAVDPIATCRTHCWNAARSSTESSVVWAQVSMRANRVLERCDLSELVQHGHPGRRIPALTQRPCTCLVGSTAWGTHTTQQQPACCPMCLHAYIPEMPYKQT